MLAKEKKLQTDKTYFEVSNDGTKSSFCASLHIVTLQYEDSSSIKRKFKLQLWKISKGFCLLHLLTSNIFTGNPWNCK